MRYTLATYTRLQALCVLAAGLSACKPEPPKVPVAAPLRICAAFDVRVAGSEGLRQARRQMFEAAMTMDMKFVANDTRFGVRDEIGGPGYPMRFVLESGIKQDVERRWLRVEHIVGGPAQKVPWLRAEEMYIPPSNCLARGLEFTKLRDSFGEKWQVFDLDVKKPTLVPIGGAASQPLQK
jgi:hypothetical protein